VRTENKAKKREEKLPKRERNAKRYGKKTGTVS